MRPELSIFALVYNLSSFALIKDLILDCLKKGCPLNWIYKCPFTQKGRNFALEFGLGLAPIVHAVVSFLSYPMLLYFGDPMEMLLSSFTSVLSTGPFINPLSTLHFSRAPLLVHVSQADGRLLWWMYTPQLSLELVGWPKITTTTSSGTYWVGVVAYRGCDAKNYFPSLPSLDHSATAPPYHTDSFLSLFPIQSTQGSS